MLIQTPFFFALFTLSPAPARPVNQGNGIGAMSHEQVTQLDESTIFGATLSAWLLHGGEGSPVPVTILTIVMILAMTASQFITQKQIMARSMPEEATAAPFMRLQKVLLCILPVVFGVGGVLFSHRGPDLLESYQPVDHGAAEVCL
jgi:YidC/Oxa1 family membrane protein insertase